MESIDPTIFFNLPNFAYWGLLGLVVFIETREVSGQWGEQQRYALGYLTLFGSALIMVTLYGWDFYTWLLLLLAVLLVRLIGLDRLLLGDLWARPARESHRWTLQYFAAFVASIPLVIMDGDVLTWAAIFFGLGLCGAIKVGYEAAVKSYLARQLRRDGRQTPATEEEA